MSSSPNGQHETSESASSVMATETITADTPLTTQQSTHSAAASNTEISTMLYAVIIRASLLELQISSAKGNNSNSAKRVELKDACTKALSELLRCYSSVTRVDLVIILVFWIGECTCKLTA